MQNRQNDDLLPGAIGQFQVSFDHFFYKNFADIFFPGEDLEKQFPKIDFCLDFRILTFPRKKILSSEKGKNFTVFHGILF